ncbi:type I-F CRISPR-associated protein Csy2, partial [Limnobacter sp.]|uniref:type I-F CRISPR-associated protein Csy2 n=1 Tax=Limnobacter sp. TaxID=2003368 RepID=UPI002FE1ABD6
MSYRTFLLIPHLKIHNANAMSSPYTIGFPAMTAWLGATHALQRRINQQGFNSLAFKATAVSCHHIDLQTYKGKGDYVYSIIGTANPLDKDGNRPAFVEEARCHIEVTLLVETEGLSSDDMEQVKHLINEQVQQMKFASGDVMSVKKVDFYTVDTNETTEVRKLLNKLMLGTVLIERRDLMIEAMKQGQDALDALLEYIKVNHRSTQSENGEVTWRTGRKTTGWIVPIAVGFQGLTELGFAKNQRDTDTPHRFAESVLTLGEFLMPYRVDNLDTILWQYHSNIDH